MAGMVGWLQKASSLMLRLTENNLEKRTLMHLQINSLYVESLVMNVVISRKKIMTTKYVVLSHADKKDKERK